MSNQPSRGIHLVGSVPLVDAEEVFRTVGSILGPWIRRVPDGETGERSRWIQWQRAVLMATGQFEEVPTKGGAPGALPLLRLREGISPQELVIGPLGYAHAAKESYATFSLLRQSGVLPAHCRFQVSLPTPLAPIYAYILAEHREALEPVYEAHIATEVDEILAAIPHDDLAIQWDTAIEFALLEGVWFEPFREDKQGVIERLIRLGNLVASDVELGYHLCYGDAGHRHFIEPKDTAKLVEITNGVSAGVRRPVQWFHMPVPRDRSDDAYYAPLRGLSMRPETELFLGLLHRTDGVEGTRRRMAAAERVVSSFGIATECGLGRRPAETIPDVLRLHAEVAGGAGYP